MRRRGQEVAASLLALLVGAVAPAPALALGDTTATAEACSVAAGRDARNNSVVCNIGWSPEQVRELTEAAVRGATASHAAEIADLSDKLSITRDATRTLLRIVGEQDVPLDRLNETLNRVANDFRRLQKQVADLDTALAREDPVARGLIAEAQAAIKAGSFSKADELLEAATQAQIAAAQQARQVREKAQAAENAKLSGAAASTAVRGDLALTRLQYRQAAELFGQAAELVPPDRANDAAGYRERQAHALYREGDERGDNSALVDCIAVWHAVLQARGRARVPLDWARTQMNLGNALQALGERESGTARLEAAVRAYEAALQERTRERVPLQWATTQMNLGATLAALGEREGGTARLEAAVRAYEACLTVTATVWPEGWVREVHRLSAVASAEIARRTGR